jgi:multiple sugar transport system substrate-binding protein
MKRALAILLAAMMALALCSSALAQGNTDFSGVLRIIGPGPISSAGEESTTSLETGIVKPGRNDLFKAFQEDYPNVTIEYTPASWSDWVALEQAAVAGGTADVILHGSMYTDLCYDLSSYLERDKEVLDALASPPEQYRYDESDYTKVKATGVSYCVNPYYALVDLQLLKDWGIEAPADTWTWKDLLKIAQAATGVNPVTGKQNYGCLPFVMATEGWKPFSSYCASQGIVNLHFKGGKYDTTTSFASKECASAFQFFYDLTRCAPTAHLENMGNELICSADNDIVILLSENLSQNYNSVIANGLSDRFLFLPLPVNESPDSEAYSSSYCGTSSIAIARNAQNPDLAWEFIKWLVTDEYAQQWLVGNQRCPASRLGIKLLLEKNNQNASFATSYNKIMNDFWDSFAVSQFSRIDITFGDMNNIFTNAYLEMIKGNLTPAACGEQIDANIAEDMLTNK